MRKLQIVKILISISLLWFESQAQSNLPSVPCPNIFEYVYLGGKYVGIITVKGLKFGQTTVEIDFTVPGNVDSSQQIPGDLSLHLKQDKIFEYISSNQPIQFIVSFPTPYTVPRIAAIRINGATICSGPKDPPPRTTWNFEYTMTVNSERSIPHTHNNNGMPTEPFNNSPFESAMHRYLADQFERDRLSFRSPSNPNLLHGSNSIGRPPFTPTSMYDSNRYNYPTSPYSPPFPTTNNNNFQPLPYPTNRSPSYPGLDMWPTRPTIGRPGGEEQPLETICGQENNPVRDLIVNGRTLDTPKFPWVVAIYKLNTSLLQFQCGGNLISTRTILSVAHCFKEGTAIIPNERLLFSLGRFKLTDWQNSVNIAAQEVILHPDYGTQGNYIDADIAIVLLKDSASFSHTIRPICLWKDLLDDRTSTMTGSIVGWGEDGSHRGHVDTLKIVNTTIVSDSRCVRENPDLFHLTSNRTLCAGYKDGSGPCTGDSGSGLMIRIRDKWMLRGLVARSLAKGSEDCNLNEFAIFTDVAKFADWIKQTLLA